MTIQLNPYHLFQHDGRHVLINIDKMSACHIEDNAITSMLQDLRRHYSTRVENIMEQRLKQLNLIPYQGNPYIERRQADSPIGHVVLVVTHDCNMKCTYCCMDDSYKNIANVSMNSDTAFNSIDWLIEQSGDLEILSIGFFGGEPFLNFPVIKEAVLYARTREKQTGKKFGFRIVTNGSLLNSDHIAFIKKYEIGLTVSLDGSKKVQDTQRPFRNGKGSYDVVIDKIRNLTLLSALPNTRVRATLTGANNPVAVESSLREIGFKDVVIRIVSPNNKAIPCQGCSYRDYSVIQDYEVLKARRLLEAVKERNLSGFHKANPKEFLVGLFALQFLYNIKKYYPCGAGKYHVAISPSDDVYLCHRFMGNEEYKLGTIFNSELDRAVYVSATVDSNAKCSQCFAKHLCCGCYHENLIMNESIFEPVEDTCTYIRSLAEHAASFCCDLQEEDKDFLLREGLIPKPPRYIDLF